MSGYVTLAGGDFRSTTINYRQTTEPLEGSVSGRSSASIGKERIAIGLVREGLAMEYGIILGVLQSTLTLVYLLLQLLVCYPGNTTKGWVGPVVLLATAPLYHLLWNLRYRGVQLRKLKAYSMHRATGIVIREWSWKSLEIIFQLSCMVIVIAYAVLQLIGLPFAGVVLSLLSLITFARFVYDLQGIHEVSLGRVFHSVVAEAWTPLLACLSIIFLTTASGMLSSHYIAAQSGIISGLVVTLEVFVDGVVCVTAACSVARAHGKVSDEAERSRLCINNLAVKSNSFLKDIQLSLKHAMKLNETTGLTFWQLLRLIDGCSANYHSSHGTPDVEAPPSMLPKSGEVITHGDDDRILGWEIVMDMAGEARGLSLWRYLTEDWAEERLETVAPSAAAPKLPILVSGQNARMTSDRGSSSVSPPTMAPHVRRRSPEQRIRSRGAGDGKKHRMMPVVPPTYEESYKKGYSEQIRYQRENSAATAESTPIVEAKGDKKSFLNRLRDANTHASPTRPAAANSPAAAVHRPRGSSNGGGGMATSSSSAPAGEGSSEGGDGSSKEGIRRCVKDLLSRYLDRLIAHLVRHGTDLHFSEQVRLSILTALNMALDEGLLDPLFVMKAARDVGLPCEHIPAGRGIGLLDDRDAVLPTGPLIRVVRFLDPIDAANFARTSRLHAEAVRHPLTTGGLVARSDLPRPALRAVQHLLRHSPLRFGPDSLLDGWAQGHLETLDVDFTAVIRSGHCDSRAKRVLARLGSIAESLDDSIRVVRFAKCADVGEDPVPIIRTLGNSRAMAAVKSLVLDGLILEPSPQRSVRLPARMENLRRLELTQITVVRGCTLLPDDGSVVLPRLSRLVMGVRPESAALEVAGALLRRDGECNLVELRVFHLTTQAAVDALAETLPMVLPQLKYLEVGPWTDRLMQRVGHYTELEELSGMGSPSMATPVHVERVLAGLSKLRRLRLNAVDEDTLTAVTRGVTSSGASVEDISVQYSGRDSIEATLAMVRLRVACHHVRRVQCPRANFMRTSPSTETRDRGGPLGISVTVPGERLLGEEFHPRLVCNCARCLLHGGPESEDHFSRNVAAVWSLLTPAERTRYNGIAAGCPR
ncbi:hypothetical protein FOL46_003631 [Perkinsus olseni]|uniref:Uncharacterized protein n=1 Tax=Perkinsus olseni TaxID=32597 RepID=A0A7J6MUK3_PEROL|nr:hypothetical protein FOL46_003631 [Perkinsus olseni]